MVIKMDMPGQTSELPAATKELIAEARTPKRIPNGLILRLEYFPDQIGSYPGSSRSATLENWDRVFEVSDKTTLEQFATIILDLLGWEEDHLYEFHIGGIVYVHMGDPNYSDYLLTQRTRACRARSVCTISSWRQDRVRLHLRLRRGAPIPPHSPRDISAPRREDAPVDDLTSRQESASVLEPAVQHTAATASGECTDDQAPAAKRQHILRHSIRSSRGPRHAPQVARIERQDVVEKAVTVLENRSLSVEKISEKIERPVSVIQHWIVHSTTAGWSAQSTKKEAKPRRARGRRNRGRNDFDILHDRPRSFGISRASWNLISLAKAYHPTAESRFRGPASAEPYNRRGTRLRRQGAY
ncbi:MAG: hypothetical protein IPK39_00965 [Sulfuritalea sp.]|nr:hypothetical protein [Sulfuritalea sp.]